MPSSKQRRHSSFTVAARRQEAQGREGRGQGAFLTADESWSSRTLGAHGDRITFLGLDALLPHIGEGFLFELRAVFNVRRIGGRR